ncbi:hypothetical protein ACSJFW_005059, partial [Escherichia coli]
KDGEYLSVYGNGEKRAVWCECQTACWCLMAVLPDARHLLMIQKVQMMNKDRDRRYGRKRYTTGAMCFMLFVWLGGVVALFTAAAVLLQ